MNLKKNLKIKIFETYECRLYIVFRSWNRIKMKGLIVEDKDER